MHPKSYRNLVFIFFFVSWLGYGQSFVVPDSLKGKTSFELISYFQKAKTKQEKELHGRTYIEKAKKEGDTASIADGFSMLSTIYKGKRMMDYTDSIIRYTSNKPDPINPAQAYITKGEKYFEKRKLRHAIDYFLIANEYIQKFPNTPMTFSNNHMIGLLKDRIGASREALQIHKKNLELAKKNYNEKMGLSFSVSSMHAIAFTFKNLKAFDSAMYYNKKGMEIAKQIKNESLINHLLLNEGVINYHIKKIDASKESILQALNHFEREDDKPNRAEGYFYLAKIYKIHEQEKIAIKYLKKVDTTFIETQDLLPELRETYEILINYYKKNGDKNSQLQYITKLVTVDSVLNNNYKYLSKKITKEYDTPRLLEEKQKLITALEQENKSISSQNIIISILLVLSLFGGGYYYYRQRIFKRRFIKLLDKTTNKDQENKDHNNDPPSSSSINKEAVNNLLDRLQLFEEKQGYLKTGLNAKDLAKSFGSNSTYLSKVVNTFKEKSFSMYINDLRINFVIDKLKEDAKFRKYTVKAIAQEIGFNNSEAFSKAFYKNTGIYPSYFIKEIEKQRVD